MNTTPRRMGATALLAAAICLAPACTCGGPPEHDTLIVLMEAPARTLDPRFATADVDVKVSRLLFAGLVTTDTPDGRPALDLAEHIEEPTPGETVVTLREDARFHDGTPVRAADVVYTFTTLDDPAVRSPFAGAFRDVAVVAVDERTVRFVQAEPTATFIVDLDRGIVPRHILEERGRFEGIDPIGAGAWRWAGRDRDGTVRLERVAPDDSPGAFSRLAFRPVPDDNSRLLALLAGAGDLTLNTVAPLMLPVVERHPDLVVERSPSFKYTYLAFNLEHPLLGDTRVRQAIAHALDREEIVHFKFRETATLARNLIPPGHWAEATDARDWPHDPARARALLDAAALPVGPDGCRAELTIKTSANRFRRSVATVMAAQLTAVGLCTRVQSYEWGTFFEDIRSGNFEMTTLQWPAVTDPDILRWVFHSESIPDAERRGAGANRGRYRNAEVDRLLDAGRIERDPGARAALYRQVQHILAEELPYVSLWHEDNLLVRRRDVMGFTPTPHARFSGLLRVFRAGDSSDE